MGDLGDDIFDGGADNDTLEGYGRHDVLTVGICVDILYGGDGFDWLVGGAGNDTFAFAPGSDEDPLADFTTHAGGANELQGHTLDTFAAVMAAATEWNGNTYLHLDGGAKVALNGVAMSQLTANDFQVRLTAWPQPFYLQRQCGGPLGPPQLQSSHLCRSSPCSSSA